MAAADVRVAGASRYGAGLPPLTNPYLEVFVDRGMRAGQEVTVQANLWVPIELSGQREKRVAEVDALVRWKTTARQSAAAAAVGEAVAAYGEAIVAMTRLREAQLAEQVARDEAAYVAGRYESKDATVLDKAWAEGEIARWLQAKAEAQLAASLARARLSVAIGEPGLPYPPLDARADLPQLRSSSGEALAARLLRESPVLRAAEEEAAYFRASRDKWEADKYAPVNFIATLGRGDIGEARVGGGLAWTFPLLRRNQSEIARADADAERALNGKAIAAAAIQTRTRGSFAAYEAARAALATIENISLPAAQQVVDASVDAWRAGKLEMSRVFLARRDLAAARARRLDVIAAGWQAYAELTNLAGDLP